MWVQRNRYAHALATAPLVVVLQTTRYWSDTQWRKKRGNVINGTAHGRPLCIYSVTSAAMCVPSSFERPMNDRPARWPLCDCFEHAQNFTATMTSIAMSERPLCQPWLTKATFQPPLCLQRWPSQLAVAQGGHKGRSPCVKGVQWFEFDTTGWINLPYIFSRIMQSFTIHLGGYRIPTYSFNLDRWKAWQASFLFKIKVRHSGRMMQRPIYPHPCIIQQSYYL